VAARGDRGAGSERTPLSAHHDIDQGLEHWSARETPGGAGLSTPGRRFEEALLGPALDFAQLEARDMEVRLQDAEKLPEELLQPGDD
jgi:hypothetical protein